MDRRMEMIRMAAAFRESAARHREKAALYQRISRIGDGESVRTAMEFARQDDAEADKILAELAADDALYATARERQGG